MKINTRRLKTISSEIGEKHASLAFELIPEQVTSVNGHCFKIEISNILQGVEKCLISIKGTRNTYFPKAWVNWKPVIKSDIGHIEIQSIQNEENCVSFEIQMAEGHTYYSIESYEDFEEDKVFHQLEALKVISISSTILHGHLFSFVFGKNPKLLIVSRQHPGEAVASIFVEGILTFLQQNKLHTDFILVPTMALRGLINDEYRTNDGFDLNRSWDKNIDEIHHVRNLIETCGITEVLDVHGDEITKIAYTRVEGNPTLMMPHGITGLASTSTIRKLLSRIRNKVKTSSKGCSLRDYCKAKKISCTLLELPMSKDTSFQLGFEFAKANLMQK